jgi:hypothetical protein
MTKDASPRFIRRTFLTGLLILIPLFVTYALIAFLFNIFTNASAPLMRGLFRFLDLNRYGWTEPLVPLINFLLSLAVIFLLGLFGANFLGRRILQALDALRPMRHRPAQLLVQASMSLPPRRLVASPQRDAEMARQGLSLVEANLSAMI